MGKTAIAGWSSIPLDKACQKACRRSCPRCLTALDLPHSESLIFLGKLARCTGRFPQLAHPEGGVIDWLSVPAPATDFGGTVRVLSVFSSRRRLLLRDLDYLTTLLLGRLGRKVLGSPAERLQLVGYARDVVAVEHRDRFVSADAHRHRLGNASPDHGPHGCPPEAVKDPACQVSFLARLLPFAPEPRHLPPRR